MTFLRFPLVWMVIGIAGVVLVSALTAANVLAPLGAAAAVVVYWAVMRFVADRPTPEITRRGVRREVLLGVAVGLGFVVVSVLLIAMFGGYSFSGSSVGFWPAVIVPAMVSLGGAVTEELIFRGFALQGLERLLGSRWALVITALVFGGAHLFNPAASLWSSLAIAVEAGVLVGAGFLWRRNIWFVAALHWAWNFAEGLLGIPVSGHATPGLFTTTVSGGTFLTGGGFGLEASFVPVLVSVAIAVPMLVRARRAGALVSVGSRGADA